MARPGSMVAPLAAAFLLGACDAREITLPHDDRADTLARLEKITAHCGLPTETLGLTGDGIVTVRPSPDSDYAKVDCVLTEIQKTDLKQRYAFVGNEAHDAGNRQ